MEQPKKKAKKWKRVVKRIITLLIILLLLAGAGFYAYSSLRQKYTTTYDTYSATIGSISNALSFSGSMQLIDSYTYQASANCTVRQLYVQAGDDVKEDQKLMRLSNGDMITAEFDGRVNVLNFKKDDTVYAGDTLIQIADFTHMKVNIRIDEYDISDVQVGTQCNVTATATEKTFQSEIASIDYISASNGNVAYYTAVCYVDVDEKGVYPGMQVTVTIPQEEASDVVVLKMDALSFDEKNSAFVWMKDENEELVQKYVTVGVSNGNYVEIKEGLNDGDEVYVEVEVETESAVGSLLGGLFGRQQMNAPSGGMPNFGGGSSGGMPDFSSFGGGNMPNFGGGSGGSSGRSGGSSGGFSGGGRP